MNYSFVDRFTLAHALVGIVYGALHFGAGVALGLAVAWELAENPLKAWLPALFPHASKDRLRNAAGDVAAVMCGWGLWRWITTA